MHWMFLPLKRYADFSGRSRRMEYWMFTLFLFILIFVIALALPFAAAAMDPSTVSGMAPLIIGFSFLFMLALYIPSLAVQVRRFHDIDMSGWSVFLGMIPLIGTIIVLVCMFKDGTPGENRFGPNPKETDNIGDVFA